MAKTKARRSIYSNIRSDENLLRMLRENSQTAVQDGDYDLANSIYREMVWVDARVRQLRKKKLYAHVVRVLQGAA